VNASKTPISADDLAGNVGPENKASYRERVTGSVQLRFALAIAKHGTDALLIDSNNKPMKRVAIAEAVRLGGCFAVTVDDEVLALDADEETAAANLERHITPILTNLRIEPVLVASGGIARRHLFARVADSNDRQFIATLAQKLRCDVRSVIRPPLSPHRSGLVATLIRPRSVDQALRLLSKRETERTRSDRPSGRISARMFELLRDGDKTGAYRSRSEVVQAVALAAVNAGLSPEWLSKVLTNPHNRSGEKVREIAREKGNQSAQRYVEHAYEKARSYALRNPPVGTRAEALGLIKDIEREFDAPGNQYLFAGKRGPSLRAVLQALIGIAKHCGRIEFEASYREICEHAGIRSRRVVHRSLKRLACLHVIDITRAPIRGSKQGRYLLRSFRYHSDHTGGVRRMVSVTSPFRMRMYGGGAKQNGESGGCSTARGLKN
jgi:hypothetical protein